MNIEACRRGRAGCAGSGGRALLCIAAALAGSGCPGIRTGLVRATVVERAGGAKAAEPVAGASCALDDGSWSAQTDAQGVLTLSGAPAGTHALICRHGGTDGVTYAAFRTVDLPREAGRG